MNDDRPQPRDFLKAGRRCRRRRRRSREHREARLRRPRAGLHASRTSRTPTSSRSGAQVRPQLGPWPDPRRGRDQPADPEARLRDVRRRPGQLGKKEELDHGAEMLSKLHYKTHYVMGEHDYYLDLGAYWSKLFGPHYYSFDHKGVHFVVLNSILTYDDWTTTTGPPPSSACSRWPASTTRTARRSWSARSSGVAQDRPRQGRARRRP